MLSYSQLRDWAARQLHEDPDDTVLTTLFLRWVNDALGEIASAHPWQWLEGTRSISLGAHGNSGGATGGITYLPEYVQEVMSVWPTGLGYRQPLTIVGAWELDALSPSTTAGTIATYFVIWGYYNTARDVSTAGTITGTASGGASAENAQYVVEGINDSTGLEHREEVTLNSSGVGTSSASFSSGPDGVRRLYVVESSIDATPTAAQVGRITFTDAGSQTLEIIDVNAGERMHEHLRTELEPRPSDTSGTTHLVRYYKRIRRIYGTDDVVEIPFEFEDALWLGILRRLADFQGDLQAASVYDGQFKRRIFELKRRQGRQTGRLRGLRSLSRYGYRKFEGGWAV